VPSINYKIVSTRAAEKRLKLDRKTHNKQEFYEAFNNCEDGRNRVELWISKINGLMAYRDINITKKNQHLISLVTIKNVSGELQVIQPEFLNTIQLEAIDELYLAFQGFEVCRFLRRFRQKRGQIGLQPAWWCDKSGKQFCL